MRTKMRVSQEYAEYKGGKMKPNDKRIFIDVDGVLCDWVGGVIKWFNLGIPKEILLHWETILDVLNMKEDELFSRIAYPYFWEELEPTFEGRRLAVALYSFKPCILTAPARGTATWRQNWIKKHYKNYYYERRYLIGPAKDYCAHRNSYLIDDYERNVDCFNEAGGNGILYPQPWNRNRDIKDKIGYVMDSLGQ